MVVSIKEWALGNGLLLLLSMVVTVMIIMLQQHIF